MLSCRSGCSLAYGSPESRGLVSRIPPYCGPCRSSAVYRRCIVLHYLFTHEVLLLFDPFLFLTVLGLLPSEVFAEGADLLFLQRLLLELDFLDFEVDVMHRVRDLPGHYGGRRIEVAGLLRPYRLHQMVHYVLAVLDPLREHLYHK